MAGLAPMEVDSDTDDYNIIINPEEPLQFFDFMDQATSSSSSGGTKTVRMTNKKPREIPSIIRKEGAEDRPTRIGPYIFYYDGIVLGKGSTAIVYKGFFRKKDKPAAIKRITPGSASELEVYKSELKVWKELEKSCENVIRLYDWKQHKESNGTGYYFCMELADATLHDLITDEKVKKPNREQICKYLLDAAKGLNHLHVLSFRSSKRVIHRDIKPENILICSQGPATIAKLADFGISRFIKSRQCTGTHTEGKGTDIWLAPEILEHLGEKIYCKPSMDIFAFGLTGHFALTGGSHPFQGESNNRVKITWNIMNERFKAKRIENSEFTADHLFQWMMEKSPEDRPTIIDVLNHPFFWDYKKCIAFLLDICRNMDKKEDKSTSPVRDTINSLYRKWLPGGKMQDWKKKMSHDVQSLMFKERKNYDGMSLFSLLELVRDKHMHFKNLNKEELMKVGFANEDDGYFSDKKYAEYFISTYPELVIFLFVHLSPFVKINSSPVGHLYREYYKDCGTPPSVIFGEVYTPEKVQNLGRIITVGKL